MEILLLLIAIMNQCNPVMQKYQVVYRTLRPRRRFTYWSGNVKSGATKGNLNLTVPKKDFDVQAELKYWRFSFFIFSLFLHQN